MFRSLALCLATTLLCLSAYGQTATGTIQGIVSDTSAAVIADAKVSLENARTGVRQEIVTNAQGRFVVPYVQPGEYNVTVEKPGFEKSVTSGFILNNQQTLDLNLTLKVGQASTIVEVSADAVQIATSTSTVTTNLTAKQLHELPTNNRNPFSFAGLSSGVITSPGSTPWISGGRNSTSEILIDGNTAVVPENNVSINDGGYTPIIDSIGEVTVIKNSLAAEYGRTGGGVISATTRGGTNDLHFGLFEFFRNPVLNANSWNNNRNRQSRPTCCSRNEFGFNVGAPVIIPGLYDGHNKTFFFWSQQQVRAPGVSTPTNTVPIEAWRKGDFSQLRNGSGQPITIYDPLTVDPVSRIRQPFPGNIIPANRFNPVALKLMEFFPMPNNVPTNQFTNANNYISRGKTTSKELKFDSRIDHTFTDKFRMFARGSYGSSSGTPFNAFDNIATPGGSFGTNTTPNITSNFVYTINATTIFNTNIGFGQKDNTNTPISQGFLPSSIGLPASMDNIVGGNREFPQVNTGAGNLGQASFTTLDIKSYAYTSHSELVKVFSKHTVKGGFEYRKLLFNFTQYGSPAGSFTFNNQPTVRVVNQTQPTTEGFGFASFLLGLPANSSINHTFSNATASPYIGWFFQDDWKVSRKLTFNLGLRWDVDVPRTERYNRLNHFDLNMPSAIAGKVPGFPNLKGGFVFQDENNRRQVPTDLNNWGPRFGFAYQITEKTVFRGAYGVLYSGSSYVAAGTSGSSGTQGYQSNTPLTFTNDNYETILTTLSNPVAAGYNPPPGAAGGSGIDIGGGVGGGNGGIFLDNQNPMIQQWSANIQRELPGGIVLEVGYLGSKGHHLIDGESSMTLNQLDPSYMSLGAALDQQVPNPFYQVAGVNPTTQLFRSPTIARRQLLSPYPQYTSVNAFRIPMGNSNYHSFTVEANKRYSNGLQFQFSFTGGKLIDDVSQPVSFQGAAGTKQDYYNRSLDKSISAQDVSRRLVVAFNYDLPVGRGRAFASDLAKPIDFVLGGWQINGIATYQTGTPIAIGGNSGTTGIGSPGSRPNATGINPKKDGPIDQRLNSYFDQAAFAQAPNYTFGTAGRFQPNLRGPSQHNLDFSIFKVFKFREKLSTTFRAEAFNAFNHPTWDRPGTAVNNPGTFGIITGASGNRTMQLALKINY